MTLDKTDRKILSMLSENARIPFLEIARECGISGAAVHQRVKKLQEEKILLGTKLLINPTSLGYKTMAYIGIFLERANLYRTVLEELKKVPEIVECSFTTGNYSLFIKIYSQDNQHLMELLSSKVQSISGIARTETFICLEHSFERELAVSNE